MLTNEKNRKDKLSLGNIFYKEISYFIKRKFKIRLKVTAVDEKTVEVSYNPSVFMPEIAVKFHIEAMRRRFATHGRSAWMSAPETQVQIDFIRTFADTYRQGR